jgi:mono/diheme cytochrome c family protein
MPIGTYEVFADGFTGREEIKNPGDARFRPCGLAFGPDGTLYIGDSEKGRIWRVVYTGERVEKHAAISMMRTAPAETRQALTPTAAKNALAYKTYCAVCHMENGGGVSGLQPALIGSEILVGDPTRLLRVVINGPAAELPPTRPKFSNVMPAMGFLPDAEIAAALTHARENFVTNASAITPAQVFSARSR